MTLDGLTPRGGDDAARHRSIPADLPTSPAPDREVPLPPGSELVALHAWLDGEVEEMPVTNAQAARQREVWRRINEDTAKIRRMVSPPFLEQKVMQAIAQGRTAESIVAGATAEAAAMAPTLEITWPVATGVALACAALGAAIIAILG